MSNTHQIIQTKGHYEAYDEYGNFVLSGDTYEECYNDLIDIIVADGTVDKVRELKAEGKSFTEIGNIIGKSRQQASQIYYKSIARGC